MLFSHKPKDAVDKLKADHDTVEDLIKRIDEAGPDKKALGQRMCNLLKIHMTLEEELFYPALRGAGGKAAKLDEGIVEHDTAKFLINDIVAGTNGKDDLAAKLQVLGEAMKHHQDEEEERGGIFAQARDSDLDLEAMLGEMLTREAQLKTELKIDHELPAAKPSKVNLADTR